MPRKAKRTGAPAVDAPSHWIKPQLTRLVEQAPDGSAWLHEIKLDGYRMHARIDGDDIRLLTRTDLTGAIAIGRQSRRFARCLAADQRVA